ncbi:MAG: nucleotidyl transferase AbiEii/AbiGii toxin family protein [Candidatus Thermoplasmatota archaeon]|nr:nucleotidyl transferase AbiEii/AbiGii toxin family protein [Candidatus Thermoplasmatota archaeon]
MIEINKIKELARLMGMRPWQQEKHYLLSLILSTISDLPLVFKGGTYLWMFHGLRRFSEDLDFTTTGNLREDLPEFVSTAINLFGYSNDLKVLKNASSGISARYMINGPLNTNLQNRCVIYVEISARERLVLPKVPIKLDFPQYDIPVKRLLGMNLSEVGAEKVRAILTRDKARDIYDLNFLIERKNIRFETGLINKKLEFYDRTFEYELFLDKLKSREQAFNRELKSIIFGDIPPFETVLKRIENWVLS